MPPPGSNITFNITPESAIAVVAAVQITTTKEKVPGIVMTRTTSATTTLALLRPLTVLVATTFSPSLTPQLRPSASLKTIVSPTPGPQGLAPLAEPVTATPEP